MEIKERNLIILGIGLFAILLDFLFLQSNKPLMYFIMVLLIIMSSLPFVVITIVTSGRQKEKEERFLEFARDLVENVKAGTPVGKAIANLGNRDYGALTGHVKKLTNQLALGIPLTACLINFAKDTESEVISRAVSLISEAEKSGGQIDSILNSVANSVNQTEELRKQQKASVYNLVVQGYIIFFVFIIIVLVLQYYLLPLTSNIGPTDTNIDLAGNPLNIDRNADLGTPLLALLLVQSLFAGIVIGKIAEGNFKDGIKHAFILVTTTLLISTGAALFLTPKDPDLIGNLILLLIR